MTIDPDGDIPVYLQLAAILRQEIESGAIQPRRAIPSKKTLRQRYDVSAGTVEHAVQVLKDEGYLRTVTGRGLYVRAREEWPGP
jgi:GntR family transcriptional regulator